MKVVNGQYGPYLSVGKRNIRIPKDVDAATLTLEDCLKLAGDEPGPGENSVEKGTPGKKTRCQKTTATAKKATAKKITS